MSIDVKQLLKVAKQALSNKHNKIAIEKCEVIGMHHRFSVHKLILISAGNFARGSKELYGIVIDGRCSSGHKCPNGREISS